MRSKVQDTRRVCTLQVQGGFYTRDSLGAGQGFQGQVTGSEHQQRLSRSQEMREEKEARLV